MLAPSATHFTPLRTSVAASSSSSSFCVAQGSAMSTGTPHGLAPATNFAPTRAAYSLARP